VTVQTTYFRVTNGVTEMVQETILHTAPTDALIPLLSAPIDSFLLNMPNGLRHVRSTGNGEAIYIVIEQMPAVRTITFPPNNTHRIGIPWVYFIFTATRPARGNESSPLALSDWRVFCAPNRIQTLADTMYALPTNNVSRDGRICFGSAAAEPGANIGEHLDSCVTQFWNSNFNQDIRPNIPHGTYDEWARLTETNPNIWQTWTWDANISPPITLAQALEASSDRVTAIDVVNGIPNIPMRPTWGRVNEWVNNDLTTEQRLRLLNVLQAADNG
jgi:hypothetical protein